MTGEIRIVVFVCPHGAGKSRVAAALFQAAAPPGWHATSAGLEPQEQVSEHAAALLAGDPAGALLDDSAPRHLDRVAADLVVGIDCVIAGARTWELTGGWPDSAVREQLRELTGALAGDLAGDR